MGKEKALIVLSYAAAHPIAPELVVALRFLFGVVYTATPPRRG